MTKKSSQLMERKFTQAKYATVIALYHLAARGEIFFLLQESCQVEGVFSGCEGKEAS